MSCRLLYSTSHLRSPCLKKSQIQPVQNWQIFVFLANAFLPPPFPSQLMTTSSFQLLRPKHPGDFTNAQENHFGSVFRKYAKFNHFLPPPQALLSSESLEWVFKNIESAPVILPRTLQWFSIFLRIKNKDLTMQGFVRSDRMTTFLKCHSSLSYLSSSQESKLCEDRNLCLILFATISKVHQHPALKVSN